MIACPSPGRSVGLVRGLTQTVDCNVHALVHDSYGAMFGRNLSLSPVFTAVLTIYVAVLGYRLLMGRSGVRMGDLPTLGLKLGVILAFTTSWATYQTVVFDLAFKGPEQIASALRAPLVRPHSIFTTNVYDGLQFTFDHLVKTAGALADTASANAAPASTEEGAVGTAALSPPPANLTTTGGGGASAPSAAAAGAAQLQLLKGGPVLGSAALWLSAATLITSALGVILISKVVLGLLLALGPVFIATCLFEATQGFAVGWLRTTFAFAFAPLATTVFLAFLLTLIEPSLLAIEANQKSGEFDIAPVMALTLLVVIFSGAFLVALKLGAGLAAGFTWPKAKLASATAQTSAAPVVAGQVLATAPAARDRAEGVASAVAAMQQREARGGAGGSGMRRINVEVQAGAGTGASSGTPRVSQGHRRLGDAPGRHRFQRRAS